MRQARTPLLKALQKAFQKFFQEATEKDEDLDRHHSVLNGKLLDRRRFIGESLKAGALLSGISLLGSRLGDAQSLSGIQPKIVIVGGGISWLNAAHHLLKVGMRARVF